jgi:hypothetical protein
MAHYAFIDHTNTVIEVITGRHETEVVDGITDWEAYYSAVRGIRCLRTSYNHNIRKQYAGIGFTYDPVRDEFVSPPPYPSWELDANNDWQAPTAKPEGNYGWDESSLSWVLVSVG